MTAFAPAPGAHRTVVTGMDVGAEGRPCRPRRARPQRAWHRQRVGTVRGRQLRHTTGPTQVRRRLRHDRAVGPVLLHVHQPARVAPRRCHLHVGDRRPETAPTGDHRPTCRCTSWGSLAVVPRLRSSRVAWLLIAAGVGVTIAAMVGEWHGATRRSTSSQRSRVRRRLSSTDRTLTHRHIRLPRLGAGQAWHGQAYFGSAALCYGPGGAAEHPGAASRRRALTVVALNVAILAAILVWARRGTGSHRLAPTLTALWVASPSSRSWCSWNGPTRSASPGWRGGWCCATGTAAGRRSCSPRPGEQAVGAPADGAAAVLDGRRGAR